MTVRNRGLASVGLVVRITIATTLSFYLAREFSQSQLPIFAPMTTLLVVQASPFSTIGQTAQRVLGTMLGVGLTTIYVTLVPLHWWTIALAILLALLGARALPLGLSGQLQVPIAAVFVLALGPADLSVDLWRMIDVLMGAAIGVAAVFVAPPKPRLQPGSDAVRGYLDAVMDVLRSTADEIAPRSGRPVTIEPPGRHAFIESSRALRGRAASVRDAVDAAIESTRFNLRRRDIDLTVTELEEQLAWVGRLTIQVRSLSGAVDLLYDRPDVNPALPREHLAGLLRTLADLADSRFTGAESRVAALAQQLLDALRTAAEHVTADGRAPADTLGSLGILGRVEQLRELAVVGPAGEGEVEERAAAAAASSADRGSGAQGQVAPDGPVRGARSRRVWPWRARGT
jgi:uncharacterized membrane protein YgaE (UPF0421/DUF939 family)